MSSFTEKGYAMCGMLGELIQQLRRNDAAFGDLDKSVFEFTLHLIKNRLIPQSAGNLEAAPMLVFWGGTNTGKSTLINSIFRKIISPAGVTAGFTRHLIAEGDQSALEDFFKFRSDWKLNFSFPESLDSKVKCSEKVIYAPTVKPDLSCGKNSISETADSTHNQIFLDTPDVDSANDNCLGQANLALEFADIAVWVTTAQKYNDQSGVVFLEKAMALGIPRIDVFNQSVPRHSEAVEDMRKTYDQRWPHNERYFYVIDECPIRDELLPEVAVENLCEKIQSLSANISERRIKSGEYALKICREKLSEGLKCYSERRQSCERLNTYIKNHLEEDLFRPVHDLPGHEMRFELNSVMLRVIGPRLKSSVGDTISNGFKSASNVVSSLFSRVTGKALSDDALTAEPALERDNVDFDAGAKKIASVMHQLRERIRRKAERGTSEFASRLHDRLKIIDFPDSVTIKKELCTIYEEKRKTEIEPILSTFEGELERFCSENPNFMDTIKYAVPGVSALAAIGAVIFSVHAFALLPGISEYLLSITALPVYKKLEDALPEGFLKLAQEISGKPFIRKAKDGFSGCRRAIFRHAVEKIIQPVDSLLITGEDRETSLMLLFDELENDWRLQRV
ncbi:MAG: 50S ribosome-binding GTPase [Candidatus Riflebacteria bacterium]|nr:50S ribosome-binding GTPase [Candidatus Riflebacteria bacterium]